MVEIDRLRMLWMAVVTTLAGGWLWGCVGDEDSTENGASDMGAASGGALAEDGSASDMGAESGGAVAEDGSASDMGAASGGADLGVASGEDCDPSESTVLDGDFSVRSVADGRRIACYTEITGILEIYDDAVVSLPNLVSVGGLGIFDNPTMARLGLPALANVGEFGLNVSNNPSLTEAVLPALTNIGGGINSGGGLIVYENPVLTSLVMPSLLDIGGSTGISSPALAHVSMPVLRRIGSNFNFNYNESIVELDLPELASVGLSLNISENRVLERLSLPRFAETGGFLTIFANESLCQSVVDEIAGRVNSALVQDVSGNRDGC